MQEDCERDALKQEIVSAIEAEIAAIRASNLSRDDISIELASARVALKSSEESLEEYVVLVEEMQEVLKLAITKKVKALSEAQQARLYLVTQKAFEAGQKVIKSEASKRAKAAANALHDQPGGTREKQDAIRAIWATGKHENRDLCAEQECAALGMSFSAARKALRNTPNPT